MARPVESSVATSLIAPRLCEGDEGHGVQNSRLPATDA